MYSWRMCRRDASPKSISRDNIFANYEKLKEG
jgi:hypothetical protein